MSCLIIEAVRGGQSSSVSGVSVGDVIGCLSYSVSRKESLPPIFVCPITQEMMRDPVIAEDGYTYERQAIEEWTSRHRRSPMTNKDMNTTQLISNHALRSAISSHMDKYAYSH